MKKIYLFLIFLLFLIPVSFGADTAVLQDANGNNQGTSANPLHVSLAGGGGTSLWVQGNVGINTTANVGIGSSNPGALLDVLGNIRSSNIYINGPAGTTRDLVFFSNNLARWIIREDSDAENGGNTGSSLNFIKRTDSGSNNGTAFILDRASGNMNIESNLGIGTTFPSASIEIIKSSTIPLFMSSSSVSGGGDLFNISNGGNVGIGSTAPGVSLDVQGTIRTFGGIVVPNLGNSIFSGNVGIGTGTASNALLVEGNVSIGTTSATNALTVGSAAQFTVSSAGAVATSVGLTAANARFSVIASGNSPKITNGFSSSSPIFIIPDGTNGLTIAAGGNLGINSTNPGQVLDVKGTVRIATLGGQFSLIQGTNSCSGTGTLASGTVTISTTCSPSSVNGFILTDLGGGVLANIGSLSIGTVTGGTSFVVNSSNALDSSNFYWQIVGTK